MKLRQSFLNWLVLPVLIASMATWAHAADRASDRELFLAAEQALEQHHQEEFQSLRNELADYPLLPYLDYEALTLEIRSAKRESVLAFLQTYANMPLAWSLRSAWLNQLAQAQDWSTYLADYRATANVSLQCYYYRAQLATGQQSQAWAGARELWLTGRTQPAACDELFDAWRASGTFSMDDLWRRIELTMAAGNVELAQHLLPMLPTNQRPILNLWLKSLQDPKTFLLNPLPPDNPKLHLIATQAMRKAARLDPYWLYDHWAQIIEKFQLEAQTELDLRAYLAVMLAIDDHPATLSVIDALPPAQVDGAVRGWRLRWALHRANWPQVLAAYEALSPQERQDERWRYWQARALEATGRLDQARPIYATLARQRSYFGFLAADRIQQPYVFTHQHLQVSAEALQTVRSKPAFQRIYELLQLDRYGDVRREWLAVFPSLSSQERLAAVQLAANWGLHQFVITGLAELGQMDDLDLRFPVAFEDQVQRYAASRQLDPALVLAIMRRESAFDPAAQSSAGARGLMQLMPGTGRIIAARLGEPGLLTEHLKEPERNIAYGTAYLAKLLDDFNNRLIFAVAAYNAGPIKVQTWLQNTLTPVPGDVWVETLPYHETREYVAAVLSYLAIYQQRLGRTPTTLSNFLGPVSGGSLPPLIAGQADAF